MVGVREKTVRYRRRRWVSLKCSFLNMLLEMLASYSAGRMVCRNNGVRHPWETAQLLICTIDFAGSERRTSATQSAGRFS
jgi:hypothetical protein